jgi:hypothetical protein
MSAPQRRYGESRLVDHSLPLACDSASGPQILPSPQGFGASFVAIPWVNPRSIETGWGSGRQIFEVVLFMQILVRENNVDQALRALKKKLQREGVPRDEAASPL